MSEIGTLSVVIEAQTAAFEAGMRQVTDRLDTLDSTARRAGEGMEGGMFKASLAANLATKAFEVAMRAVGWFYDELVQGLGEAREAVKVQERLGVALAGLGPSAAGATEALGLQADRLERLTGVDDKAITSMQTLALQYGATATSVGPLIDASLALASATGRDANDAMQALLKTQTGVVDRTMKLVPGIRELTAEQLKNGDAVALVTAHYAKFIGTGRDPIDRMATAWGELTEAIGKALLGLASMGGFLNQLAVGMERIARLAKEGLGEVAKAFVNPVVAREKAAGLFAKDAEDEKIAANNLRVDSAMAVGRGIADGTYTGGVGLEAIPGSAKADRGKSKAARASQDAMWAAFEAFDKATIYSVEQASNGIDAALANLEGPFQNAGTQIATAILDTSTTVRDLGYRAASPLQEMALRMQNALPSFTQLASSAGDALVSGLSMVGGMVGGVLSGLLSQALQDSPALKRALQIATRAVQKIAAALEPLIRSLEPLVAVLGTLLSIIGTQLAPVFKALAPVFKLFAELVRGQALFVAYLIQALGNLWNGIVSAIATVFQTIGSLEIFGRHPLGALKDFGDTIERASINMNGLDEAIDQLKHPIIDDGLGDALAEVGEESGGVSEALDDIGKTADSVSASLTNVPEGFKVASARYDAADPRRGSQLGLAGAGAGHATVNAYITASDPSTLWEQIKRLMDRDTFARTGTVIKGGPYAVAKGIGK